MNKELVPYLTVGTTIALAATICFRMGQLANMATFVFAVLGVVIIIGVAILIGRLTNHSKKEVQDALKAKERTPEYRQRMWVMHGITVLLIAGGGKFIVAGIWGIAVLALIAYANCQLKIKRISDELDVDVTLTLEELADEVIASVKGEANVEKGERI